MPLDVRKPKSAGKRVQVINARDFTGGLNLISDTFKLAPNESPDLLNVDVDRRGGFMLRRGTQAFGPSGLAYGEIRAVYDMNLVKGMAEYHRLVVLAGTRMQWCDPNAPVPAWASVTTAIGGVYPFSAQDVMRTATMNNRMFLQHGNPPTPLAGIAHELINASTTSTTIDDFSKSGETSNAWQNSYANPGPGNYMPVARTIATHTGYLWVGHTAEGGSYCPNRIRFSHPNQPTRWRKNDYIDVDFEGDEITALVPFQDHLLIFKRNSIFAVFGYDPDSFQLVKIADGIGAVSQEAVTASPMGVFFMDPELGVHVYEGNAPVSVFGQLFPLIRDGHITPTSVNATHLGWVNGRLWCGVAEDSPTRSRTYVFDPNVGENGSWTRYGLKVGCFASFGETAIPLATQYGSHAVQRLEVDEPTDNFSFAIFDHIPSYFTTVWVDDQHSAVRKRWKRFELVTRAGVTAKLLVSLFRDYDTDNVARTFYVDLAGTGNTLIWDSPTLFWDGADWEMSTDYNVVEKGGTLGLSRAVQLRIDGPATNQKWGVDALLFKFIPKKVR